MLNVVLGISTVVIGLAAAVMFGLAVAKIVRTVRLGRPVEPERKGPFGQRLTTVVIETLGHTRMLKWRWIGVAHWFIMVSFPALVFTVIEAQGEVFDPKFTLPLIADSTIYGLFIEVIAAASLVGIVALLVYRLLNRRRGRSSRFANSRMWTAYYVESYILGLLLAIFVIRGFKVAMDDFPFPVWATPVSHAVGSVLSGNPDVALPGIVITAAFKLIISYAFFIVLALVLTMGVGWHRFTAPINIYFKRNADGAPSLGPAKPMMDASGTKPLDFEEADPDVDPFGAAKITDFSWKGLLDFTTCTECGRCQTQCPAWNTGKPLSPKKVVMDLRDHTYATAPHLLNGTTAESENVPQDVLALLERPLVGTDGAGVIDAEELWACTNCGACVEECPVDIEHIDHILDMRRHQVMVESDFPTEANSLLKNLEEKGNPWGMAANKRMEWISELDFEVPVAEDSLPEGTEYLFWVGCAGSLEDRGKKTTKAIAELLHTAGVKFAVLGQESCTGDPARRLGMEYVFQMMAEQNIETLNEIGAYRIVASCPHCFNTLGREYPELGGKYEVIHHTQLLAQLVESGKLTPVNPVEENITYHDPCFLGRHNKVYTPPREIMEKVPGVKTQEMHRCKERGFCCGAGGARMWMEERTGKRINTERVDEALTTNPDTISTGCPYCQVMLGDAVNEKKAKGEVKDTVEVIDVSQLLVRSVRKPEAATSDAGPAETPAAESPDAKNSDDA
ncbi:4Fe-4S dicluster domain-containing protein [Spiractinospora alimapuensis]|uniref:heterodisulfide reductase-related iron-sulfur binding cluster n=1 Tax=Spiractinospora alimapuensis TaxID=2820884 RepID=UPI001F437C67|nr:heterodisulfide reductase-related iron-sulfur binding cluster [Spiractinospora alimapuensis]QVQ50578.1 4Fe-4S dicluster domain-containing protein [Spiractinospora alimapuensis]